MLALIMFSIVSVLSAVMASMWQAEIEVRNQERNSLRAFCLAQAGAEEAKAWARNNSGATTSSDVSLGGGRYRYVVSSATGERIIDATGETLDSSSNVIATRKIQLKITGSGASVAQVSSSWDEK
ncbi:MAG: hypothetical protein Q7J72_07145 [Candidatus Omnitrophota bacterium]|nr:hypothetical protein [Candidatus Omnitrophota bacterium]